MRIGVDVGGTKIEAIALDGSGQIVVRHRVETQKSYDGTLGGVVGLVEQIERETGERCSVGVGIPGTIEGSTGLVKNANSTWLIGKPFDKDLSVALEREVRVANDANCLVVSEATDGAAAGLGMVFGVIVGTGCGGGVAVNGRVHAGPNGVAGEWGHIPLPWAEPEELPGPPCYCGKTGCMETWISGTGLMKEFARVTGRQLKGQEIVAASEAGDAEATAALDRLESRMARGLASIINVLDPEAIVIGGGVSRIDRIYAGISRLLPKYVFGGTCTTPVLKAIHGDSSGVRGAAWLWPPDAT
ncbi:MAG TPA: ROK family protein [Granulicella sp.]